MRAAGPRLDAPVAAALAPTRRMTPIVAKRYCQQATEAVAPALARRARDDEYPGDDVETGRPPRSYGILGAMSATAGFVLVQLGDLHIGADWVKTDPSDTLAATVDSINDLDVDIDAVLVLGDLAEHGQEEEYESARSQLERLNSPLHLALGNHDDRTAIRRVFGIDPVTDQPLQYALDLNVARLIVLDSSIPGRPEGDLDDDGFDWLERELDAASNTPTVLAVHHPPILTGAPAWDQYALSQSARVRLQAIVTNHPQICLILGAHLHRSMMSTLAGRPVFVAPSTYAQFPFKARGVGLTPNDEPPGYALHIVGPAARVSSYWISVH